MSSDGPGSLLRKTVQGSLKRYHRVALTPRGVRVRVRIRVRVGVRVRGLGLGLGFRVVLGREGDDVAADLQKLRHTHTHKEENARLHPDHLDGLLRGEITQPPHTSAAAFSRRRGQKEAKIIIITTIIMVKTCRN